MARTYLITDAVARSRCAGGTPYAAEPNRGARPDQRGRRTGGTSTDVGRTYAARWQAAATAAGGTYEMGSFSRRAISRARSSPRAFDTVSSYSASGSESATIPAPA